MLWNTKWYSSWFANVSSKLEPMSHMTLLKVSVNEPFDSESESHTVDKLFEEAEASRASTSLLIFFTRCNSEVNREHTFFVFKQRRTQRFFVNKDSLNEISPILASALGLITMAMTKTNKNIKFKVHSPPLLFNCALVQLQTVRSNLSTITSSSSLISVPNDAYSEQYFLIKIISEL